MSPMILERSKKPGLSPTHQLRTTSQARPKTRHLLGVAATLMTFCACNVSAQDAAIQRQVSVSGQAEQRVAPDMASIAFEVLTQDRDPAIARREADAVTARVLEVLTDAGLAEADIDSTGLSISPQYRWIKAESRQELTGYRVSRSVEVRLLQLEKLGILLEQVSNAGVNRIEPPRLGLQDEESVYQAVLAEAANNARARAAVVAEALGATLGPALQISTQDARPPQPVFREMPMMAVAADAGGNSGGESYQSGHLNYRVTINASFALQ